MKNKFKSHTLAATIAAFTLLFSSMAFSLELSEAKQRGLVGEQINGYLGAVVMQGDVKLMLEEINAKRKAKYQELAAKNNLSLAQVETLAANKAYGKTSPGHFIQVKGAWVKK
jgi:uncharacterized protein YdbL (DUF1318 family)